MYEEVTSNCFTMQSASNDRSYGSSYYGDPSAAMLTASAVNTATGTYADMLLQPSTVGYAAAYSATDGSSSTGCKQSYYNQALYGHQENISQPSTRYMQAGQAGGHHPGRAIQLQVSSTSSSPSAAAAAAVAEATAALRLATSTSMFAVNPPQPVVGSFSLRGPTADGLAVAARLAAGAAAAAADFVPTSAGPSSDYSQQSSGVGLGKMTQASYEPAFHLSSASADDVHRGLHGFQPVANGFLSTAGSAGGAYSPFQKLQTPWTTSRMTMDAYSSLDVCKFDTKSV